MSYILDALKKSEKSRRHATLTEMLAVQDTGAPEPKRRIFFTYLVLAALLVNAGLFVWWLHPWQKAGPSVPARAVVVQAMGKGAESPSAISPGPSPAGGTRQNKPAPLQRSRRPEVEKPVPDKKGEHSSPEALRDNSFAADMSSFKKEAHAAGQKVIGVNELPSSVQQTLPGITISAHYYDSRPASRVVSINGRVLHEGQPVAAGLALERITPEGVILSYRGYRFRMDIF